MSNDLPPAAARRPESSRAIFQVVELVSTLKHGLEMNFPALWVEGEISNFMAARSGHWYFTLKDDQAQIRCACFRNQNFRKQAPSSGQRVLIRAKPTIFTARGELQLLVEDIEDAGDGALHLAFERLKRKLSDEGLFDAQRKLPIPPAPRCIGIITSPVGAALQDVLTTLRRRNPLTQVIVYPVLVQGDAAPAQINAMLNKALARNECDVILLTRGGGSLEDLQAFNDETLARSIAAAKIPIVSAVGHEVDFSISDFVADARAATPTAAAELLSPDQQRSQRDLVQLRTRLLQYCTQTLRTAQQDLKTGLARLRAASPQRRLQDRAQLLDDLQRRLVMQMQQRLQRSQIDLSTQQRALQSSRPQLRIQQRQQQQQDLRIRLINAAGRNLAHNALRLQHLKHRLNDLAPSRILARGYAIPWLDQAVLRDADLADGTEIKLELATGKLWATSGRKVRD